MIFQDFEERLLAVAAAPQASRAVNNISHKAVIPPCENAYPHRRCCGHQHGNRDLGSALVWESIAASPPQRDRHEQRRHWKTTPMLTACMHHPAHPPRRQAMNNVSPEGVALPDRSKPSHRLHHHHCACHQVFHGGPDRHLRLASAALHLRFFDSVLFRKRRFWATSSSLEGRAEVCEPTTAAMRLGRGKRLGHNLRTLGHRQH